MKTHDAIVKATDEEGNILFIKTFDCSESTKDALECYSFVAKNFDNYSIGIFQNVKVFDKYVIENIPEEYKEFPKEAVI